MKVSDMAEKQKKNKPFRKRICSVIYSCMVVLLVIVALIFIFNRINHRATFIFNHTVLIIATGSMEPEIPTGSCILVARVNPDDIKIGDIITFYSDDPAIAGSMNTHRVVSISKGSDGIEFTTKGDANYVEDSYTAKGNMLVGKYIKVLPVLTAISSFLLSGIGFFILIFAFVAYTAFSFVRAVLKNRKVSDTDKKAEFDRKVAEEVERLKAASASSQKPDPDGTKSESSKTSGDAKADNDASGKGESTKSEP